MEKLIKNGEIYLDGTLPKYQKEKMAFEKLEEIEKVMAKYGINTTKELEEVLTHARKKINLAKALTQNKNCFGYIIQFNNGKYTYQNDNDLGLDIDGLNHNVFYEKKIYLYKHYYAYLIKGECEDDGNGVELDLAIALLKECHKHIIPLTEEEKQKCKEYWNLF